MSLLPHRSPGALLAVAAFVLATLAARPARAHDVELPPGFEDVELPDSFILLTDLVFAPDGTLFVVQKQGIVRIYRPDGSLQPKVFLDISGEVNNDHDRGLLALALPPDWLPDGGEASWVYLAYTVSPVPGQDLDYNENDQYSFSRLSRFRSTVDGQGRLVAVSGSKQVLLGHQQADGSVPDGIASLHHSHSNGTLLFGSDGTLLFTTGDGAHYDFADAGGADDAGFDDFVHPVTGLKGPTPKAQDKGAFRAQMLGSLSGKVLRLDPATGRGLPSNPFYDGDPNSLASRVWALGLRNPFRAALLPGTGSVNPADGAPGTLLVGDVGWNKWEDLNVCRGGENFGWPCFEGPIVNAPYAALDPADPTFPDCATTPVGVPTSPALTWNHFDPTLLEPTGLYVDDQGAPLPGFAGNCALAGFVHPGTGLPAPYAGRLFFADYDEGFIKTADLGPDGRLLAVHDFAEDVGAITTLAANPLTGEIFYADIVEQHIHVIRHTDNLTPVPVAIALSPPAGPLPLTVDFDGSGSEDPEGGPLAYSWDWGDGSAPATGAVASHTWTAPGIFGVRLTVTDDGGLPATTPSITVVAGDKPPVAQIVAPPPGATFTSPTTLGLHGAATDPDDDPIDAWAWTVDLYHDTHIHPASYVADGPDQTLDLDVHDSGETLVYYRIELAATDLPGATGTSHVFAFEAKDVVDLTGQMLSISSLDALVPPGPQGPGQHDIEVVRDTKAPPPGSTDALAQWDSVHPAADPGDFWIGYELILPPGPEQRFTGLDFTEGLHAPDGGWFDDFRVEVRSNGTWHPVENLACSPPYPFELADEPGFDGEGFDSYRLDFDPVAGNAIRLRGTPGGSGHHVSVAELRVRLVRIAPVLAQRDVTDEAAEVIARVFGLSPPGSEGKGNHDPEVIRDGSFPPAGSASLIGEFDTQHGGPAPDEDWLGYRFDLPRLVSGLVWQEGLDSPRGGTFLAGTLRVETRLGPGDAWEPVGTTTVIPPLDGPDGVSYQTRLVDFPPVLAREVRLIGQPSGILHFTSAGELRVLAPAAPTGCEPVAYGTGDAAPNSLVLQAIDPPFVGLPFTLHATGAAGPAPGVLGLAFGPDDVSLFGGHFLLQAATYTQALFAWDAQGGMLLGGPLPDTPSLVGVQIWCQAFALGQPKPFPVLLSNGLALEICPAP